MYITVLMLVRFGKMSRRSVGATPVAIRFTAVVVCAAAIAHPVPVLEVWWLDGRGSGTTSRLALSAFKAGSLCLQNATDCWSNHNHIDVGI